MKQKTVSGFPYLGVSIILVAAGIVFIAFTITGRTNPIIGVIFFIIDQCLAGLFVALFIGLRKRRA